MSQPNHGLPSPVAMSAALPNLFDRDVEFGGDRLQQAVKPLGVPDPKLADPDTRPSRRNFGNDQCRGSSINRGFKAEEFGVYSPGDRAAIRMKPTMNSWAASAISQASADRFDDNHSGKSSSI